MRNYSTSLEEALRGRVVIYTKHFSCTVHSEYMDAFKLKIEWEVNATFLGKNVKMYLHFWRSKKNNTFTPVWLSNSRPVMKSRLILTWFYNRVGRQLTIISMKEVIYELNESYIELRIWNQVKQWSSQLGTQF